MTIASRGVAGWALALLLATPPVALAQPLFTPVQDPVAGERLFNDKGCAGCHAINGVGGTVGPDLGRRPRPRTFYDVAAALWNHAPAMAARMHERGIKRPPLTAAEAGDIVAYLYTLSYFDPPGRPAVGQRLFTEKRCVACHSVGGAGGTVGPPLGGMKTYASPIALAASLWNHGPQMAEAMAARKIERPTFNGTELLDLIAYLNAASPKPARGQLYVLPGRSLEGHRLFADKGCALCHVRRDKDRDAGGPPDLTELEASRSLVDFAAAMWNKAPLMMPAMQSRLGAVPRLAPDEMSDIVAYLYSVRYFKQAGDPRRGVILAVNKGCLDCHALYGERGKPASDLTAAAGLDSPPAVLAALWKHSLIDDPRPLRDRRPWPTFRADEMADLVAYLRSLRRTP
ncbi:MAG TPA: c-type cytochrome [Methylomirabilota bacterium]|nr:c-type cytochrome [Methylomirabilota bacterium]